MRQVYRGQALALARSATDPKPAPVAQPGEPCVPPPDRSPAVERVAACLDRLEASVDVGNPEQTVLYFFQADDVGPIKIGLSTVKRVDARLRNLQVGCPFPLRPRRCIVGDRELEKILHRVFASLNLTGEWFWPAPILADLAHALPFDD